eukprot:12290605-Prorocentrum_lima.AAC.1
MLGRRGPRTGTLQLQLQKKTTWSSVLAAARRILNRAWPVRNRGCHIIGFASATKKNFDAMRYQAVQD